MSRTLRRPMFRGGKIDSRGSGITSGLDKPKRGLVDEPGGYAGISMSGLKNYADIFGGSGSGGTSGGQITNQARGSTYSRPAGPPSGSLRGPIGNTFTRTSGRLGGAFRFPMLASNLSRLAIPSLSTTGLMAAPFAPVAGLAYLNRPKNLEALQIMKDEPASTFDETGALDFQDYTERLVEAEKGDSEKISFTDALFMDPKTKTYPKIFGRTQDRDTLKEIEKQKQKADDAIVEDFEVSGASLPGTGGKNIDVVGRVLDVAEKTKDAGNILDNNTILNKQNTANEELTLEEIKDTLGFKKARGRDLGDMFGRGAAAFIGAESLSEGAQKFFEAESRSGPGRAEKIETAAATFLLKDKQQTKQNKAMIEQLKAKIDYQIEKGDEISIQKSILAATKGGTGSNKEIARGIQGGTSPNTGKKYKFAGVVDREGLKKKIGTAEFGDTFIVQEKIKDSITGADTTARIIVEIQKDGSAKPIYNLG